MLSDELYWTSVGAMLMSGAPFCDQIWSSLKAMGHEIQKCQATQRFFKNRYVMYVLIVKVHI